MAEQINYAQLLSNPDFMKEFQKGLAIGQTLTETPVQPEVTASAIQPEPMYIEPSTTTYTGLKDESMPDMPPSVKKEESIYDKMMEATTQKKQQELLYQLMSKSMQQQEAAAQSARDALKKEQERQAGMGVLQKLDLRPFAQALRGYGSTSVGEGYAPEMTELQRQELMRKLQGQVEAATQGVTKEQVAALRTMQDQKNAQAMLSMGNQEMRAFENVQRKFDKPQQSMLDFYQSHDAVKSALDSGDIYAVQSALSNYARMSGEKGVLTDEDIKRVIPVNLQTKFAGWWSKVKSDPTVQAPEGVITALQAGLGRLKLAAETKYKNQITTAKNQTSRGPGIYRTYSNSAYEEAQKVLRPEEAGAAPQGGLFPSIDAIQAERKRREAEKGKNK